MGSVNQEFYQRRIKVINPEVLENYRLQNKSIILMMGHHNNWEWASQIISIVAKQDFVGIYKKLSNKFIDYNITSQWLRKVLLDNNITRKRTRKVIFQK